jgi:hypothetical protein
MRSDPHCLLLTGVGEGPEVDARRHGLDRLLLVPALTEVDRVDGILDEAHVTRLREICGPPGVGGARRLLAC